MSRRKLVSVLALAATAALVFAATSSAQVTASPKVEPFHYITSESLTCKGLSFSWADFPQGDNQFVLKWWNGTTQTVDGFTDSNGTGSIGPIPLPVIPPNGTDVSVVGTWTADGGGSFDVSQTVSCQPVVASPSVDCAGFHYAWTSVLPNPAITTTWEAPAGWGSTITQELGHSGTTTVPLPTTPANGTTVVAMASWPGGSTAPVSFVAECVTTPTPPTPSPPTTPTPPTPPSPPTTPPTSCKPPSVLKKGKCVVPPSPPTRRCVRAVRTVYLNNQDGKPLGANIASSKCANVPISVTVGPQGLIRGVATLRGKTTAAVRNAKWTVAIYGQPGRITWRQTFKGRSFIDPLRVTNTRIFGLQPPPPRGCGCDYNPHVHIVVVLTGRK